VAKVNDSSAPQITSFVALTTFPCTVELNVMSPSLRPGHALMLVRVWVRVVEPPGDSGLGWISLRRSGPRLLTSVVDPLKLTMVTELLAVLTTSYVRKNVTLPHCDSGTTDNKSMQSAGVPKTLQLRTWVYTSAAASRVRLCL
jgi:hypothetical protein